MRQLKDTSLDIEIHYGDPDYIDDKSERLANILIVGTLAFVAALSVAIHQGWVS